MRFFGHTFVLSAGASLVLMLLAGCAVDNDREVARYRRVLDDNVLPTIAPATAVDPLTLPQAMALANQNNEQLARSGEDYVQALINKNRAVASFLPTVSFQPSYTILDKPNGSTTVVGGTGTGVSNGGSSSFRTVGGTLQRAQAPVVGSINLFRGFGDVNNLHAVEQSIAQRRDLLLDLQSTVLLNVAQTYYQILASERSADVLRNSLSLQETRLRDVETQFRAGLASQLTLSQTRAQLAATHVQLTQAIIDARNGRATLAQLIGWHDVPNPLVDRTPVPASSPPEPEFESFAMQNRQDIRAAERARRAAQYNVQVAVAQYYPSIDLNLEALLYADSYASQSKWNAVLQANLPIFRAGLIEADVRTAWSKLRQAALDESSTRRQVVHDVQTAYENLAGADQRIKDLNEEVRAAEDAYRLARQGFQSGLATNLDVLTAQNQMLSAQLDLSSATFDRTVFYLDLIRATGELVDTMGGATMSAATQPATMPTSVPGPAIEPAPTPTPPTTTRPQLNRTMLERK